MMNKKEKIEIFLNYLDELFPDAHCELNYRKDYELLIAVMLSAQATDKSVNKVTEILFSKYDSLDKLYAADVNDIQSIIKPLGMSYQKSLRLKSIVKKLYEEFDGIVPSNKEILMSFDGVGNKTANVVRAEFFKLPELAVDTHVERVSKRLNFAKQEDTPIIVEEKLKRLIPVERHIKSHHQIIFFGRYFCKAVKPNCDECKIKKICKYFEIKNKLH